MTKVALQCPPPATMMSEPLFTMTDTWYARGAHPAEGVTWLQDTPLALAHTSLNTLNACV